ncbi:MAG: hypothetical protein J6C98_07735 [Oscillospiraceae bacterium]|nr:hypothetical protein [Oscillospiraceae bacterium]
MHADSAANVMTTMDWITFGIAVFSFVLSVYNFVETLVNNSKRLSVSVKHLCRENGHVIMLIEFTNRSQLGISITCGKLVGTAKKEVVFGETSRELFRYNSPEAKGKSSERTLTFPLHIDPLRSERVLLQTEHDLPDFSRNCRIVLGSSRGKLSKKLELPIAREGFVSLLEHLN